MPLRHAPFGIPHAELEHELVRRRRWHRRALAARLAALRKLRARAADLTQSMDRLAAEIRAMKAEEQELLQALSPAAAPDGPTPPASPPDPLAELRETLIHYRTLQTEISAGVLALIAPFLKEGTTWTSTRRSG
jgi:hypothetical protein